MSDDAGAASDAPRPGPQRFAATIYRVGMNYCVDAPARVSRALGDRGYVPVAGTADGHPFRTTLTPRGGGKHRLFLDGAVRTAAGVGEGDRVTIALAVDNAPREASMPGDLARALSETKGALEVFEAFTATQRRSMITFIEGGRRAETRARRVRRVIDNVAERLPR